MTPPSRSQSRSQSRGSEKTTTFDAGALIAFERGHSAATLLVADLLSRRARIAVPAGVLAQVWRDRARQVRLARLVADPLVEVVPLDEPTARAAGVLCGLTGTRDVVDASVIVCARMRGNGPIITADTGDLRRLDPRARIVPLP